VLSRVRERWNRRAPTARVNEVIAAAQAEQQAPGGIRYRYATQVAAAPPRFVLFGAGPPASNYQRFLEGRLRRAFDLEGVPIGVRFRQGRRPAR
jgi:GTP-binding protein